VKASPLNKKGLDKTPRGCYNKEKRERYKTMMRTAETYIFEEMGVEMPKGNIPGSWFAENALPMIVRCTCCDTSMALPSAMIDDDGTIYCPSCAGE
jgi:hypothetical protein